MALSSITIKQTKGATNSKATFGLPPHQPQCDHMVPSLRHDYERAFRHILPFQTRCAKPPLRTLYHGLLDYKQWWHHQIERGLFNLMCHPKVRCILHQSQTRRTFLQLQRRHDFLLDTGRIGPPTAQNTGPLQQCDGRGHSKQHCQKTAFAINGNEIFWVCDKIAQSAYNVKWYPRQENLADYQSKHHIGIHNQAVHPWYLYTKHSPLVLPRATRPSTLKGCVGTLCKGYICNVPLPRVPPIQSANSQVQVHTIPDYYKAQYEVCACNRPCSTVESAAYAFSPAWHAMAINTLNNLLLLSNLDGNALAIHWLSTGERVLWDLTFDFFSEHLEQ